MMMPPLWADWLTESWFRIRVAPAAVEKLQQLPVSTQHRLRQILQDIAELADLVPPSTARGWIGGESSCLLNLHMGRILVRYSITEEDRTLTLAHVIIPADDALDQTG